MVKYFQLVRPLNLLVIVIIMALMRYALILPFLDALSHVLNTEIESFITHGEFVLLVLSVVLIAAGGNMFNDTQDVNADITNKPKRPLVLNKELIYSATVTSYILMGVGTAFGVVSAILAGNLYLALIHVIAVSSLYVYSISLKNSLLIGNFIIALLAALVPLTVGLFEVNQLQAGYTDLAKEFKNFNFNFLAFWVLGFSVFAFVLTLAREITKDAEDIDGDRKVGASTLPIEWGIKTAQYIVASIYLIFIGLLWYVHLSYLPDLYTKVYVILLTVLAAVLIFLTVKAKNARHFHQVGTLNKVVSLIGVGYALLSWYMVSSGQIFAA